MSDDMRADLGVYGSPAMTPHLDALLAGCCSGELLLAGLAGLGASCVEIVRAAPPHSPL
jgi:hypothetical protein